MMMRLIIKKVTGDEEGERGAAFDVEFVRAFIFYY